VHAEEKTREWERSPSADVLTENEEKKGLEKDSRMRERLMKKGEGEDKGMTWVNNL